MFSSIRRSVSKKLIAVVLVSTLTALLVAGVAMLGYDMRNYDQRSMTDLATQADVIGQVTAPALNFDDARAARENLNALQSRPTLLAAAVYAQDGRLFASWQSKGADPPPPVAARAKAYSADSGVASIMRPIASNGETIGWVYISARYELLQRLQDYALILAAVMAASLVVAALLALWLQSAFTRPLLQVAEVARSVVEKRDFTRRAPRGTDDEVGVLVEAFNTMLDEVARRTAALEETNRVLQQAIEERQGAEQALRVADRRKDEFLATLAHELRNPLAPMTSGLEILSVVPDNPAASAKAREIMQRQLRHMVRLIDDLLDVSRITTGKLAVHLQTVSLQTVVSDAIEAVSGVMQQKNHRLETSLPTEPLLLQADPTRLVQVFYNLLSNAARYTPASGHIRLRANVESDTVKINVSDNGIGLDEDGLQQVFEMFVQADQSLERINAGLGVGLTLARRLTELHGGSLTAASAGRNQGATFTVTLPCSSQQALPTTRTSTAEITAQPTRVLLVDDNVDYVSTLGDLLRQCGHDVLVLHNGDSAIQQAPQFRPQVAFIDIGLPGMNGFDLARRLRTMPALSDAYIVAVTGWGQDKDKAMAREAGFDGHLVKPVQLAQIQAMVARSQTPA